MNILHDDCHGPVKSSRLRQERKLNELCVCFTKGRSGGILEMHGSPSNAGSDPQSGSSALTEYHKMPRNKTEFQLFISLHIHNPTSLQFISLLHTI